MNEEREKQYNKYLEQVLDLVFTKGQKKAKQKEVPKPKLERRVVSKSIDWDWETFVDENGVPINKDSYRILYGFEYDGYALIMFKNEDVNLLRPDGSYVFKGKYDAIHGPRPFHYDWNSKNGPAVCDGLVGVRYYDEENYCFRWNYVDLNEKLFGKEWYSKIMPFCCGLALNIDLEKNYVIIDRKGREVNFDEYVSEDDFEGIYMKGKITILPVSKKTLTYCVDHAMDDYKIKHSFLGYRCTSKEDKFTIKYQPIRIYDKRFVLCYDVNNMYLFDKVNNKYSEPIGALEDIDFDENFVFDKKNGKVFFIYDNKITNIANYYNKKLKNYQNIKVRDGIKIKSIDEFYIDNETSIVSSFREAEAQKRKIEEEQKKETEMKKLLEMKKRAVFLKKQLEIREAEARYQAQKAFKEMYEIRKLKGVFERDSYDWIIQEDEETGIKYIVPFAMEDGIREQIDFSAINLSDVVLSGVNLSNTNARIDPQRTLNKDMSNSKFDGVFFSVKFSFEGVDIRGSSFTSDKNPDTMDIRVENFIGAIYDEKTTLNGEPLKELLKNIDEDKEHGSKSA